MKVTLTFSNPFYLETGHKTLMCEVSFLYLKERGILTFKDKKDTKKNSQKSVLLGFPQFMKITSYSLAHWFNCFLRSHALI